ncbi:ABC transporter permease [Bowdeniella nasicola]|nr:ABC transporter permease [Bowdeniella nasicola]
MTEASAARSAEERPAAPVARDERSVGNTAFATLMRRPEIGAVIAALVVLIFFSVNTTTFLTPAGVSTWLESSSTIGIMAVAVALLMIGGHFDLSAGVMTGTSALFVGVLAGTYGVNLWVAVVLALVLALAIGAANGAIVLRTGLPSFIVTLGTFFILQGVNLAVTKMLTGTVALQGIDQIPGFYAVRQIFGSTLMLGPFAIKAPVIWFVVATIAATWVLQRTRGGNHIFAVGGDRTAARAVGVRDVRTIMALFMTTAGAGWLVGMLALFKVGTAQATTGVGQEFIYIICAVVGGCLLTGGFGSAIGAAFGALIYGMTYQGIVYAGWDNNWLRTFLGIMLLAAVLVNWSVAKRAGVRS